MAPCKGCFYVETLENELDTYHVHDLEYKHRKAISTTNTQQCNQRALATCVALRKTPLASSACVVLSANPPLAEARCAK